MIETNIDDMNPQLCSHVMERLFKTGALDVWIQQIIMKKGRPAIKLSALCPMRLRDAVMQTMLAETTTLGVRFWAVGRTELQRSIRTVKTPYGTIRFKDAWGGGIHKTAPEFEDVRRAAETSGIPLVELFKHLTKIAPAMKGKKHKD